MPPISTQVIRRISFYFMNSSLPPHRSVAERAFGHLTAAQQARRFALGAGLNRPRARCGAPPHAGGHRGPRVHVLLPARTAAGDFVLSSLRAAGRNHLKAVGRKSECVLWTRRYPVSFVAETCGGAFTLVNRVSAAFLSTESLCICICVEN